MATPTYDPIASTTLTANAASVTFSSLDTIAAGYRDLIIVVQGKTTVTDYSWCRVNGLTTSIYNYVYVYGNGASAGSSAAASQTTLYWNGSVEDVDGSGFTHTHQFLDFSATDKHKSVISRQSRANGVVGMTAARIATTSAITSILLDAGGGNWQSGSTFSLYGVAA